MRFQGPKTGLKTSLSVPRDAKNYFASLAIVLCIAKTSPRQPSTEALRAFREISLRQTPSTGAQFDGVLARQSGGGRRGREFLVTTALPTRNAWAGGLKRRSEKYAHCQGCTSSCEIGHILTPTPSPAAGPLAGVSPGGRGRRTKGVRRGSGGPPHISEHGAISTDVHPNN